MFGKFWLRQRYLYLLSLHSPKWSLILVASTKMPRIFQKMVSLLLFLLHLKLSMNICNLFKNWELKPEFRLWMINEAFITGNLLFKMTVTWFYFTQFSFFLLTGGFLISEYLLLQTILTIWTIFEFLPFVCAR